VRSDLDKPLASLRSPLGPPGAGGAAAFDIASLFADSQDGAWYDIQDLSCLFEEVTGTQATLEASGTAPAVGDPVGTVIDKSGNGHHMRALDLDTANRPTLRQTAGGIYYLENAASAMMNAQGDSPSAGAVNMLDVTDWSHVGLWKRDSGVSCGPFNTISLSNKGGPFD